MGIMINWDCNLDYSVDLCYPKYSFRRLDNPDAKIARGWNFRYAQYYSDGTRTMYKAYGIRFQVFVQGRAGKFNFIPLLLNVGSGFGLMAITTIICDIVVLYIMKKRKYYKDKKFLKVEDVPYEE
jgi:P2X purinoceptor 4